ncbi:MAG: LptF/LptG family permease [Alphaproteobacteria bacterium]
MLKFATYLSKSFLSTWLITVFGFLTLIGLLDSMANAGSIMGEGGGFSETFRYMIYRAPVIFDRIFMFTIMVATLLVFVKLIRNHELVALLGFGISAPKQFALLFPVVLFAGVASITVINFAMPPAVRALQAWGVAEYKVKNVSDKNPLWMEDSSKIVRVSGRPDMNTLSNLELFSLDKSGTVIEAIWAEFAIYNQGGWMLQNVQILPIAGSNGEPRMALRQANPIPWDTKQTPASIARLAAEPRDLSLRDMRNFREKGNSGGKPRFAYGFWFMHRITRPLAALILLLCAVPIMQRTGREDTGDKALIVGITLGFIFLIIDGAMATFATSGGMAVASAIAIPLSLFFLLGAFLCVNTESLKSRSG